MLVLCRPLKVKEGQPHPDLIVETASLAAIEPPDPHYRHHLQVQLSMLKTCCAGGCGQDGRTGSATEGSAWLAEAAMPDKLVYRVVAMHAMIRLGCGHCRLQYITSCAETLLLQRQPDSPHARASSRSKTSLLTCDPE